MHLFCKRWIKLLFLLPTLVFFSTYTLYPLYSLVTTTFTNFRFGFGQTVFSGFGNYKMLLQDPHFLIALKNTFIVTCGEILLILPIAFLLGLLLNRDFRGNNLIKLITFTPYIISGVLTSLVWFFVLDPRIGILNAILKRVGLGALAQLWIGGEVLTPYSVAVIDSWKAQGFYAVLVLAGLKMIPRELYEAATIDGASAPQKAWTITIPMLRETLKTCVVYVIIAGIQTFQTVLILTRGQPNYKSHVVASLIYYEQWDIPRRIAYGCTMALFMFVVTMGISIGFLSMTRRRIDT
jgi:raffinose/stachyose/melibiose transport system permease protein